MAFKLKRTDVNKVPPFEFLPAGAITPKWGMALTQSSGKLAIATGTTIPTYVSMIECTSALTAGDIIPVMRVLPDMVWETTAQAALTSVNPGDKVTIHTDGMQVTATKTNGVAEIIDMDGTAAGSLVRVRLNPVVVQTTTG
jgi:hypothetical protein